MVHNIESAKVSVPPLLKEATDEEGRVYYTWKNDLMKSEKFWMGWFKGLNQAFLTSKFSKILLLASNERLDKELQIAHMQGRFKMTNFIGEIGHCMMEDDPHQTAEACHSLLQLFRLPLSVAEQQKLRDVGIAFFVNDLKPYHK